MNSPTSRLDSVDPAKTKETPEGDSVFEKLFSVLRDHEMEVSIAVGRYLLSHRMEETLSPFAINSTSPMAVAGGELDAQLEVRSGSVENSFFANLTFRAVEGGSGPVNAGLKLTLKNWSRENYVLMPGAVYAGNRFAVSASAAVETPDGLAPDMPITITNVPRLEIGLGASRIQLLTGDFSTPAIGIRDAGSGRGFFILTNQGNSVGDHGLGLSEAEDGGRAVVTLQSPGVREGTRYNGAISTDRGVVLNRGEILTLEFGLYFFDAPEIQSLFDIFFSIRNDFRGAATRREEISFSACNGIQQAKYNSQNWVDAEGYYSVGMRESAHQDWQTGWVGGTNVIYPLLCDGDAETRRRALRTFDFLSSGGVGDSGFYRSLFHQGEWLDRHLTLTRYHADTLYFFVRSFQLHQKQNPGSKLPAHWLALARDCADAFCKTWGRYGQFGQRVDTDTGDIIMGGTACAGLAPGALALCSQFFNEPKYLEVAEAAAEGYFRNYVQMGITNGGPGDMLQCPDSESAFGLLEAFVTLYEVTGDYQYIDWARDTANQCASWVVTYDFRFPPQSTFGKLGMLTTGTVLANVQNKHSAPGICTLSGNSLLKLFRATGDVRYLDLIREIAHAIPQYMSRSDRPICDRRPNQMWPVMDPGWVNERVNMSDWEVRGDPDNEIRPGEIFGGSTWAEVALLLTFSELPGIYLQQDTGLLAVFDHVESRLEENAAGKMVLEISNPTKFPASVKIFVESSQDTKHPLGTLAMHDCPRIDVPAGATVRPELASIRGQS